LSTEVTQESQVLLMSVPRFALREHLTVGDIEGCE